MTSNQVSSRRWYVGAFLEIIDGANKMSLSSS